MPKHDDHKSEKHDGPKERELAVELTVAILQKADVGGDLETVERTALDLYRRVLHAVGKPAREGR